FPIVSNVGRDISIRRYWKFGMNGQLQPQRDYLEILENGKLVEELDENEYQDRISALLPLNVSQFFFFDGEKIQDFAKDSDLEFAASLKDVLGINLYAQLAEDIKTTRSRIVTEYNKNREAAMKLEENRLEMLRLEKVNEQLETEIYELQDEVRELEFEVERIDLETQRTTRISAGNREAYQVEREKMEIEKETLEKDYIEMARDTLPFLLASHLFEPVLEQVEKERRIEQVKAAQAEVEPKIQQIIDSVFDKNPEPPFTLSVAIRRYFETKIDLALRGMFGKIADIEEDELIQKLRPEDADRVRQFFTALIHGRDLPRLNQRADRLKELSIDLGRIQNTEIRSGSTSELIQQLFDKRGELSEKIGAKKAQVQTLVGMTEDNRSKIETLKREVTNWESRSKLNTKQKKEMDYCDQMYETVKEFQVRFQSTKTAELEKEILSMWRLLNHKPDLIERVQILPERNFEVKLFNRQGTELDKTKLSAGEKEIYAISLLWALIAVSGKRLPIMIDTPFGRLDSIHRRNLTQNYFPKASHQVLLLSQDEEIVGEYYELLKPCVAQEFTIENKGGVSSLRAGYPF
ncbi:MAG: DNA sulfur modification protein DndD, partial [Bacteroidota bacterium]